MKGNRFSPDRLARQSLLSLDRARSIEAMSLASALFWSPGGQAFLPSIGFGDLGHAFAMPCDDSMRVTSLVMNNPTAQSVNIVVVGWAADGQAEDTNRSYGGAVPPGGRTFAVPADNTGIVLKLGPKGTWSGFNTYTF